MMNVVNLHGLQIRKHHKKIDNKSCYNINNIL